MEQHRISRRRFLELVLTTGTLAAVGGGLRPRTGAQAATDSTAEYALIIDTTKCTGCGACVEACNLRNNLPEGQSYIHYVVKGEEEARRWFLMVQCQHCADPPCATVCPTHATYVREDGVVLINEKLCVGCKYCLVACPYQARIFDEERGVADKCWLCLDWVLAGGVPACVQACIPGARIFGRTDDPEIAQLLASGRARPLHPEFDTHPAVLAYIIEEK